MSEIIGQITTAGEIIGHITSSGEIVGQITGGIVQGASLELLSGKADKTYVDSQDLLKADKTYVDTKLSEKADKQQEAWITPTLLNGWENYSETQSAQYIKDNFGFVRLRGMVKSGTSRIITVLPAGYRPLETVYFIVNNSTAPRQLTISGTGTLLLITGFTDTWVSLDGISFKAEK